MKQRLAFGAADGIAQPGGGGIHAGFKLPLTDRRGLVELVQDDVRHLADLLARLVVDGLAQQRFLDTSGQRKLGGFNNADSHGGGAASDLGGCRNGNDESTSQGERKDGESFFMKKRH